MQKKCKILRVLILYERKHMSFLYVNFHLYMKKQILLQISISRYHSMSQDRRSQDYYLPTTNEEQKKCCAF